MKNIGFYCALIALGFALALMFELTAARNRLAITQDSLQMLQNRRPMVTALPAVTRQSQAEKQRIAELERQLSETQKALGAAQVELDLTEARKNRAAHAPHMVKGSSTLLDGTIVYGPDAQIRLRNGALVSSPTGVMVSDENLNHIDGDLVIQSNDRTVTMTNAFISFDGDHMELVSKSLDAK